MAKVLNTAADRIEAGETAGNEYVEKLESIRSSLDSSEGGTTLGTMVAAQLQMTEAETAYMIRGGLPKKAASTMQAAAGDLKKAAG